MSRRYLKIVVLSVWCLCLLGACATTGEPPLQPVAVGEGDPGVAPKEIAAEGVRFTTGPLPAGWRQLRRGEAKAAFLNEARGQSIMLNVVYAPNRKANLKALRNHLLFDLTGRNILEHELIEVDDREALWTVVEARLDGAAVKMALVVVRIDDWVYDMVYVSDPDRYEECLADFRGFIKNFHQQRYYKEPE